MIKTVWNNSSNNRSCSHIWSLMWPLRRKIEWALHSLCKCLQKGQQITRSHRAISGTVNARYIDSSSNDILHVINASFISVMMINIRTLTNPSNVILWVSIGVTNPSHKPTALHFPFCYSLFYVTLKQMYALLMDTFTSNTNDICFVFVTINGVS
jgi:hypothetical protein